MKTHQPTDKTLITEVQGVLNKLLKAQEKGDLKTFSECYAHDSYMMNIGTDLDEIWNSWDDFFGFMDAALASCLKKNITAKDTHIRLSKGKNVAWYSQLVDTCIETKGDSTLIEGFRHTGVMEKRNDKWLIVQSHVSVPYKPVDIEEHA